MKKLITIVLISMTLLGCEKEKPPVGKYGGIFNYEEPAGQEQFLYLDISESSENSILINNSRLEKDGRKITGSFVIYSIGPFNIEGTWSKKYFTNTYIIKGNFDRYEYIGGLEYHYYGTFNIESK